MRRNAGRLLRSATSPEPFSTFVPAPLPPEPPLVLSPDIQELLEQANRALGRLDGVEALLSSQIEGMQSSFSDLLLYKNKEAPGVPLDDVQEVSNYVGAMEHGLQHIRDRLFVYGNYLNILNEGVEPLRPARV